MGLPVLPPVMIMNKNSVAIKNIIVIVLLCALTGFFAFTTANPQQAFINSVLGGIGSVSLLTVIFFLASMLSGAKLSQTIKPYIIVFGLLVIWTLIIGIALRFL